MHEVYAYGVIAPSLLVELAGDYPPEAGYAEVATSHPSLGGEAAGGAYVLARLGVATKLCGTRLGNDADGHRVIELLTGAGVDCSAIDRDAPASVTEIVMSAEGERTIFATYGRMLEEQMWSPPSRDDIASSRMVCLDPFFGEESLQAARWCRDEGVPYVTIDVPPDSEIVSHAAGLVVSEEYATHHLDDRDSVETFAAYAERCEGLVILTRGDKPMMYGRAGAAPRLHEPFPIDAVDTAGAGDSFRAGIIYGLLRGLEEAELLRTASAVAAMVCGRAPGVLNSPTRSELARFLAETP